MAWCSVKGSLAVASVPRHNHPPPPKSEVLMMSPGFMALCTPRRTLWVEKVKMKFHAGVGGVGG